MTGSGAKKRRISSWRMQREREEAIVMKAKEKKMVEELLELSLKVMERTRAHISFEVSNYGPYICIGVMENGFQVDGVYEGWFTIAFGTDELTEKMQEEEYEQAKHYLEDLLQRKKKAGAA